MISVWLSSIFHTKLKSFDNLIQKCTLFWQIYYFLNFHWKIKIKRSSKFFISFWIYIFIDSLVTEGNLYINSVCQIYPHIFFLLYQAYLTDLKITRITSDYSTLFITNTSKLNLNQLPDQRIRWRRPPGRRNRFLSREK